MGGSEKQTIGSTKLSWLNSRGHKDYKGSLEVYSLRKRLRPQIEVILAVRVEQIGVNSK